MKHNDYFTVPADEWENHVSYGKTTLPSKRVNLISQILIKGKGEMLSILF